MDPISNSLKRLLQIEKGSALGYLDYGTSYLYPILHVAFRRRMLYIQAEATYPRYWESTGTVRILDPNKKLVGEAKIPIHERVTPGKTEILTIHQPVRLNVA